MDHAREVALIQTIDHDVRQLLERCDALTSAGDARPLLTLVGEQLRDQLREVAELSGSLAALVSGEAVLRASARRRGRPAAAEPSPNPDAPAVVQARSARVAPLVIRLKPRLPRGAWRTQGESLGGHGVAGEVATEAPATDASTNPSSETAREPVYRLRKAGAAAPVDVAGPSRDGRDALDRLREFFGSPSDDRTTSG